MKRAIASMAVVLGLALLGTPRTSQAEESGIKVDLQFARELAERRPVAPGTAFTPGKIYCWNELKGGEGDFSITHAWYRDGKLVRKQPIRAKGKKWVTWSFHKLTPGSWKVEVLDAAGKLIGSGELTIK